MLKLSPLNSIGQTSLHQVTYLSLLLVSTTLLLGGCGESAKIKLRLDIPTPIVKQLPVKVAMYYPPELKEYVHEETLDNYGDFRIDMTGSHQELFDTVFKSMFESALEISDFSELPPDFHGIISPKVQEVQITIPQQTRSPHYEVWIKYELVLYDQAGNLIHSWDLKAYGKANRENYPALARTSALALHDATRFALRDAAASMSFYFLNNRNIQSWIGSVSTES